MESNEPKKLLSRKQQIVLELYRQGLREWQIGEKLHTNQGNISRIITAIRKNGYKEEIDELMRKIQVERFSEINNNWLKAEKELKDDIRSPLH